MAREMNARQVAVLPPTSDIKDAATRAFLDAMTNILDARSGYTDKNAPERFVTAAEFKVMTSDAIVRAFGGGGLFGDGVGPSNGVPSANDINDAIDNLSEWVTKKILYQALGEQFGLIDLTVIRSRVDELLGRVNEIISDVKGIEVGFNESITEINTELESLTAVVTTNVSRLDGAESAIVTESQTRAAADEATTSQLIAAVSRIGTAEAAIVSESQTRATADAASTEQINAAVSRIGVAEAAIVSEASTRSSADSATTSRLNAAVSRLGTAEAAVVSEANTRASKDMALASAINTLWANIGGSSAVIQDGGLASATPNSSQATKWNQVQAAVTDPNTGQVSSTSIRQELNSYASSANGKFNSIYSVRAQVATNGKTVVGGFGLSATAGATSAAGPTIDFGVRADTFFIAATSATPDAATQIGQGSSIPFMVLTTNQVVNGVLYGPGVYLKKAVIGAATIGEAQIADASITTAKIGEAQIDTLRIRGASITGIAFGEGGGGTLPAGGTAAVASATLSMPAGSSGAVISATILMAGQGGASIGLYVYRNGSPVRAVSVSVVDGYYGTFTFSAFDPSPAAGLNTYTLQINNPTAGPGSNRAVDFNTPSITVSGAKR